jgi:hypothetical protein
MTMKKDISEAVGIRVDIVELERVKNILNRIAPYNCELRHDCEEDLLCTPL